MNLKITTLLLILTSLFAFNSLSYYLYLSSHSKNHNNFLRKFPKPANYTSSLKNWVSRTENHKPPPGNHRSPKFPASSHRLKPWPILPSYLPWSQNPDVPFRACEAYFGNGFTRRRDLISGSSWFSCHYSETLRSSICEGGRIRMVPAKIRVSKGGERLEDVIGRGEEEEMPVFEEGAFEVEGEGERKLVSREILDEVVPEGSILRHTMRGLVDSIRVVDRKEFYCAEWVEEPTLLVTRFEYANLFHTVTDWYSAYVASRVTGLPNRPRVVFVDGHCKAPLEETWRAMFSGLRYAKNYSGPVCFRHAILVPLGYETALFKGLTEEVNCLGASAHDLWQNPDDHKTARLSEFGEMIRAAFGFSVNKHWVKKLSSGHNVLFVRREDYLAHPRHGGKVQSRLSNEAEVFSSLETWASNHLECKVNLVNGLFAHMTMKEQVRAIQDASVIIGAHGAGLTHIVSATPKTVILEIISSAYMRPHFKLIAQWKGLEYHAINLAGSYANPAVVIDRLNSIMQSLGC